MRTRFAPSPTGPLHLGHAYAAILAHDMARAAGGEFLIRIEDIDRSRARPKWEAQIFDDLRWLGLSWEEPVLRQSANMGAYRDALARLEADGLTYPCQCRRRDIEAALSAPQEGAPLVGPDGPIYPGTCRHGGAEPEGAAIRLHMARAATEPVTFLEEGAGPEGQSGEIEVTPEDMRLGIGDIVLARRDMGTSYHLSVVVDDAAQGITHVTRGEDLFAATAIHALLQDRLALPRPRYHHHRLIRDDAGKRLAKRDDARAIGAFRAEGASPADIRRMVGL
ncbi:tRNA glutamyl-Q(34) synthetase GluQRS [Pseudoroseicyclus tamaricis]|uniref:tRNA glutamyl-Q(34) synthetase GluQRS n=1 Tax=Pseudoroseicyclus tamaricis TaxID=2705421 RepID=A0A6B2JXG1_9RHOB|nr:tRNA glutamyl-Q(34) synthetase GluQRS [Pseudoroseicyclus tamaricis]NDV01299.1 tRNA glutamyl-Q(34) synthetase GluQRS [Pseudoroseicyclus tamaricis]